MVVGSRTMTSRNKSNMIETKPALNDDLLAYIRDKIEKCPVVTICPGDSDEVHCMLCKKCVLSTEELMDR